MLLWGAANFSELMGLAFSMLMGRVTSTGLLASSC
jgi:hypothetical protein